jgi:transcriptional regulator with XRE-family HTH domain
MGLDKLLEQVLRQARVKGISEAQLAERAGIRPETLSRLKRRDDADVSTLHSLALAVGLRLALIPLDEGKGDPVFSAAKHAAAKAAARRRDEELMASGRESRARVHRRNAFISLTPTEVELKAIGGGGRRGRR